MSQDTPTRALRAFHFLPDAPVAELQDWPSAAPAEGFYWIACDRAELQAELPRLQRLLQTACGLPLVDLHVTDLLSTQLPSHYDYTSQYELLVMRQLTTADGGAEQPLPGTARGGPPVLRRIDTSPVGLVVFDRLLLSVHPERCRTREACIQHLTGRASGSAASGEAQAGPPAGAVPPAAGGAERALHGVLAGVRLPATPPDLLLRLVSQIVDQYLDLRPELTRQLDHWQVALLNPRRRFTHWSALMTARQALHQLIEICEDQRAALQAWSAGLHLSRALADEPPAQRELEILKIRSRDVLEHITRVAQHVRRLEQSAETVVQIHFAAQGHRTNDIMRTLTAVTAIFLPLNLFTGFFGMNFEHLPLIHSTEGMWGALLLLATLAAGIGIVFWRRRYLTRSGR